MDTTSTENNVAAPLRGRTELIVARVRETLEQHAQIGGCQEPAVNNIIVTAVAMVRGQASSLNSRAGLVTVTQQILLITGHALGQLGFPASHLYGLNEFCGEIKTLVHSTTPPRQ